MKRALTLTLGCAAVLSACIAKKGSDVKSVDGVTPFWIKIGNVEGGTVLKRFPKQSSELELRDEKCGIEANALVYLQSAPVKLQNGHYLVNRVNVPVGCHFSSGFVYVDHVASASPNAIAQKNDDGGYKIKIKSNTFLKLGTGKDETMDRATEKCSLYAGDVSEVLGFPAQFENHYAVILKNPLPGCEVKAGLVAKDAIEILGGGPQLGEGTESFNAMLTLYTTEDNSMEGGPRDRCSKPLGTLEDYLAGRAQYVSLAMDLDAFPYGTIVRIPEIENRINGGKAIEFRIVDTGGAFIGEGKGRIDLCVGHNQDTIYSQKFVWISNATLTYKIVKRGTTPLGYCP